MAKQENGHAFDFDSDTCVRCGMTRRSYEDNGKPVCRGKNSDASRKQPDKFG